MKYTIYYLLKLVGIFSLNMVNFLKRTLNNCFSSYLDWDEDHSSLKMASPFRYR